MQVILTFIVVGSAVIVFIIKGMKALKAFKKADHCKGCGSTCEGCPVAPGNRRNRS